MYQVSALHDMFPLPEIYHAGGIDVDSGYRIGLYSKMKHNLTMRFDGSLTQYWVCKQNKIGGQLPPEWLARIILQK